MSHSCYCPTMTPYFNFFSRFMINVSGGRMWETKPFNPPRFHSVLLCPLRRDKNSLWDWWMVDRGMAKFEATPHLQLLCGWYLNTDSWSSEMNSKSVQFGDVIHLQVDINIGSLIVLRLCIYLGVTMQTPNTNFVAYNYKAWGHGPGIHFSCVKYNFLVPWRSVKFSLSVFTNVCLRGY